MLGAWGRICASRRGIVADRLRALVALSDGLGCVTARTDSVQVLVFLPDLKKAS